MRAYVVTYIGRAGHNKYEEKSPFVAAISTRPRTRERLDEKPAHIRGEVGVS